MPSLEFLYQSLGVFRQTFPRRSTFLSFCVVLLGFIGTGEMLGVSSLCRFWKLDNAGYLALLHFFHSSGWSAAALARCWERFVLSQHLAQPVEGRVVLLGDHTHVPKDGTKMPGVVTLHQHSETSSKPSHFRGHHWGVFGLLVGQAVQAFCLPLGAAIHQGFANLGQEAQEEAQEETLATRLVSMALGFALRHNLPATLVLDAFFAVGPVFELANSVWSIALKQPYLHIITRAKSNYVAYTTAEQPKKRGRGRPRSYGEKLFLRDVFDKYRDTFTKEVCLIYGKAEEISYYSLNLLWRSIGRELRFVFVVTSRGPLVLMCSNLSIDPKSAIALYCSRTRIETMFFVLKHVLGAFCYHFWTKFLPRHTRRPSKNADLPCPAPERVKTVAACWEACERFVLISLMALGLLQIIALKFPQSVWERFESFLRTRSRSLPSERTVKEVLTRQVVVDFHEVAPSATMQQIRDHLRRELKPRQSELAAA